MKCNNCGYNQISDEEQLKNISDNGNKKDETVKFTLYRGVFEYAILASWFIILSHTGIANSVLGMIMMIVISIVAYLAVSIIWNKKIKLKKFYQYIFSNFFSLVVVCIVSFITLDKSLEITAVQSIDRQGYAFLGMLLYIVLIPTMFIFNFIIDCIVFVRNKYFVK